MAQKVRRVVTGHDNKGNAVVKSDGFVEDGKLGAVIWSTNISPANNNEYKDEGKRDVGITCPGGTVIRILEGQPGQSSPIHRTNSVDYGIVLQGEVDLELDNGKIVHLKTGDVVVQRGTIHAWHFKGVTTTRMAFILVDAEPVKVAGKTLEPMLF